MRIAVIGGYGSIGKKVCDFLRCYDNVTLKIGGRHLERARAAFQVPQENIELAKVNLQDEMSIETFIANCDMVLNTSGASKIDEIRLLRKVQEQGTPYITTSESPYLLQHTLKGATVIYGAGSFPGLSGLLPKALAKQDEIKKMRFYYSVQDLFTPTAAKAYLEGLLDADKKTMVVYKDGIIQPYEGVSSQMLPYINHSLRLYPYIDEEGMQLMKDLRIKNGEWFMALEGKETLKVLEDARIMYLKNADSLIQKLCVATQLDSCVNGTYALMAFEILKDCEAITLLIKADSASVLTGMAASLCCMALCKNKITSFQGRFSDLPCEETVLELLVGCKGITVVWSQGKIDEIFAERKGEI